MLQAIIDVARTIYKTVFILVMLLALALISIVILLIQLAFRI